MQTDRQTDKATHWKTAVFDVSGSDNWGKLDVLPSFVKEVHRKKEICPTTGRPHFQTHVICHRQVRLNQMTSWIKQTKWSPVIGEQHIKNSIAYIRKVETTAPGAEVEVVQGGKFYQLHELLLEVAKDWEPTTIQPYMNELEWIKAQEKALLWPYAARLCVNKRGIEWITKLAVPTLEKSWNIHHMALLREAGQEGPFIIEGPETQGPPAATHVDLYLPP